jgi:hypothetical protein
VSGGQYRGAIRDYVFSLNPVIRTHLEVVSPARFHPVRALDAISQAIHENVVGRHEWYELTYLVAVDGRNELFEGSGRVHAN